MIHHHHFERSKAVVVHDESPDLFHVTDHNGLDELLAKHNHASREHRFCPRGFDCPDLQDPDRG